MEHVAALMVMEANRSDHVREVVRRARSGFPSSMASVPPHLRRHRLCVGHPAYLSKRGRHPVRHQGDPAPG